MSEYVFSVKEPYLSYLISGEKTIEGKLNRKNYGDFKTGDILILKNSEYKFKIIGI